MIQPKFEVCFDLYSINYPHPYENQQISVIFCRFMVFRSSGFGWKCQFFYFHNCTDLNFKIEVLEKSFQLNFCINEQINRPDPIYFLNAIFWIFDAISLHVAICKVVGVCQWVNICMIYIDKTNMVYFPNFVSFYSLKMSYFSDK